MNKFKFYFILSITTVLLFSCSKDSDSVEVIPLRDYQEQYDAEKILIEEYLNTNYINITEAPGDQTDQDVEITKVDNGKGTIMSYLNKTTFPKLLQREVQVHGITYSMYYLMLREGTKDSPSNVDNVLVSYSGSYLKEATEGDLTTLSTTFFEQLKFPQSMFSLYSGVIRGWSEIIPKFKTGTAGEGENGAVSYSGFGAGVMFIPSGLGYYSQGSTSVPSYAPLVFSFKLYALQRLDHDGDGVLSYLEDLNNDGYVYDYRNTSIYLVVPDNFDDTDKDGIPNFLDIDDDGDGFTTAVEVAAGTNYLDASSHP
ncbi:FKBP-type peptidylprolyl isomerase [Flavobacterium algicola]|uniref:FKBP-type peptidylprolyl isomerase n=1 Tax=Flavobacterium algicola TaxID=556529 RepID=UPI001EFE58DA|nr:FKBP-type peptidylprolyl isomerase [Flavobacterium algicola]MCG9792788.1 FKBP-type peptidylprolyl isomerase [Flavobacterium algicola]